MGQVSGGVGSGTGYGFQAPGAGRKCRVAAGDEGAAGAACKVGAGVGVGFEGGDDVGGCDEAVGAGFGGEVPEGGQGGGVGAGEEFVEGAGGRGGGGFRRGLGR